MMSGIMLPTNDVDVHIPLRTEQVGVSPGGVTCAKSKRQKMQKYSKKKKRPYDTMDAAKAKGSPKEPDLVFSGGTSAHGT